MLQNWWINFNVSEVTFLSSVHTQETWLRGTGFITKGLFALKRKRHGLTQKQNKNLKGMPNNLSTGEVLDYFGRIHMHMVGYLGLGRQGVSKDLCLLLSGKALNR